MSSPYETACVTRPVLTVDTFTLLTSTDYTCHQEYFHHAVFFTLWLHVMQRTVLLSQFCPTVRPSVCQMRVLWQYEIIVCQYLNTIRNNNISSLSTSAGVGGNCHPFPPEIFAESYPPLSQKRRHRQISAYNVSIVRNSEKSSIMANIKSTTSFQTSYRWSVYVTPNFPKG